MKNYALLLKITKFLCSGEIANPPACKSSMEQMGLVEEKVQVLMGRLVGIILWEKKAEMADNQFTPQGLGFKPDGLVEVNSVSFSLEKQL